MTLISLVLPLAEITFLTPPSRGNIGAGMTVPTPVMLFLLLVVVLIGFRIIKAASRNPHPSRRRRNQRPHKSRRSGRSSAPRNVEKLRNPILVDGSNVMHWKDNNPQILPVQAVVRELQRRGFTPGVVFDANAGHKLHGRYMNEADFSLLLDLPESQVFVVPKGTQADPYLLDAARGFDACVVTLDRFRDWAEAHPEVTAPGFLIRGGYRKTGEFWLAEAAPLPATTKA